jgi:hypothetical protein
MSRQFLSGPVPVLVRRQRPRSLSVAEKERKLAAAEKKRNGAAAPSGESGGLGLLLSEEGTKVTS